MMIVSVDTEENYNLDYKKGTLHPVENNGFRILLLVSEDRMEATILSVEETG